MATPSRSARTLVVLVVALLTTVAIARVLGARADDRSAREAAEKERVAGFVNHLQVVNMLDVPILVTVSDVDLAQWGRIPPDDEPPAGLEAERIEPSRVGTDHGLRPLRISDGGGRATFTIEVHVDRPDDRAPIGTVPTASNSLEYCPASGECFDGYGWFDWVDAGEPALDVFRRCFDDDRVIGSFIDDAGTPREVRAVFQCDAAKFQTSLIVHD